MEFETWLGPCVDIYIRGFPAVENGKEEKEIVELISPWIASEGGVVKGVESVVVGERDVGIVVDEERQHVVPLLGYGVVERGVSFRVLQQTNRKSN